jgi:hypothetical protein
MYADITTASVDARLAALAGYEPGWLDGDGEAIGPAALERARVLALLLPGVSIFGHPDGGVSLEWGQSGPVFWSVSVFDSGLLDVHGLEVGAVLAGRSALSFAAVLESAADVVAFVAARERELAAR